MRFFFRRLLKTKQLRLTNLLGLTLIFACLLVSYTYISYETSFDRFYTHADRIVRMTIIYDRSQPDGRIYTESYDPAIKSFPDVEQIVKLSNIHISTLQYDGKKQALNNLYLASANLLDVFDLTLIEGDTHTAFEAKDKAVISEHMALSLFGRTDIVGENLQLSSRKFGDKTVFIGGVYKDIPANSHFHTDIFVSEDNFDNAFLYYYLLLKEGTDIALLAQKLTEKIQADLTEENASTIEVQLMPLTDIHLHSHVLREMEPNGNINYIYLLAGANALLMIIVLFNLWLNSGVIFSYSRRYYQLLRLNGASSSTILNTEGLYALLLGLLSITGGKMLSVYLIRYFDISGHARFCGELITGFFFLAIVAFVSLLPVITKMSLTAFYNDSIDLKPIKFSFSNVKAMLLVQYCIVTFIVIAAVCINRQSSLINKVQLAANDENILIIKEQTEEVKAHYQLLKQELLKYPEFEAVTAAMQLPGQAIRDAIQVKTEGATDVQVLSVLVADDSFFPFFGIEPIAGTLPPPTKRSGEEELEALINYMQTQKRLDNIDEVLINRKAVAHLGLASPEEAIGKHIEILHPSLGYISPVTICGVVDDFTYTNVHESVLPTTYLQRNIFLHCFFVRLTPGKRENALEVFDKVWAEVIPGYPADYSFLKDSYKIIYRNQINAEKVINLFSFMCLAVTLWGLVVFMAFMIRSRTKEIGIRKVNGAANTDIVKMLNKNLLTWMLIGFAIAVPLSWFLTDKWLENFAYKATLQWWVYMLAGLFVFAISLLTVSWQTWKAARANPVDSIKSE